jgi:type IV pilus assembly protein PilE
MRIPPMTAILAVRRGFTLIELMITVAILSIIAAIAIPAYNGYISESRLGAMRMNLDTLRIAVEAFRLDDQSGTYGSIKKLSSASIYSRFGWKPEGDSDAYSYLVDVTSTSTYKLCAASSVGASIVCTKQGGTFACPNGKEKSAAAACP